VCPEKKRPNVFFVISSIKLRRFWWNLVCSFLNKFTAISCKLFHLTRIMSVHHLVNLKCSSRTCSYWVVRQRNSRIYSTLTMASKFTRFESIWLQRVGNTVREVYKTRIAVLDLSTTPLTNGCSGSDDVIQFGPLSSQWLFQFVQISDKRFIHLLLQYSPHAVINWIQIWRIWRQQLRWDKFWSVFL